MDASSIIYPGAFSTTSSNIHLQRPPSYRFLVPAGLSVSIAICIATVPFYCSNHFPFILESRAVNHAPFPCQLLDQVCRIKPLCISPDLQKLTPVVPLAEAVTQNLNHRTLDVSHDPAEGSESLYRFFSIALKETTRWTSSWCNHFLKINRCRLGLDVKLFYTHQANRLDMLLGKGHNVCLSECQWPRAG